VGQFAGIPFGAVGTLPIFLPLAFRGVPCPAICRSASEPHLVWFVHVPPAIMTRLSPIPVRGIGFHLPFGEVGRGSGRVGRLRAFVVRFCGGQPSPGLRARLSRRESNSCL
jgi:hypothetical protein